MNDKPVNSPPEKNLRHSNTVQRDFRILLKQRWEEGESAVCVGLDSEFQRLPRSLMERFGGAIDPVSEALFAFNRELVDSTADLVCCYKPQYAFYAAEGISGLVALQRTIEYIKGSYPEIPIILDAKRSDIATTAEKYAEEVFDVFGSDAVTLDVYLGKEACQPYLDRKAKGLFFLCHTSNPGAGEFQELLVQYEDEEHVESANGRPVPLYLVVAYRIAKYWNRYGNCGLVVGATYPDILRTVRETVGDDLPILIPGIGAQGGDIGAAVRAARNSTGTGFIVSSSRDVIYASDEKDYAQAARSSVIALRESINSVS